MLRIYEHVNAANVTKPEAIFFRRLDDEGEIAAADRRIYVSSKARLVRLPFEDMNVSGKATDNLVR